MISNLLDFNKNKLLEKVKEKAPGTYFHSLNVAGIAENAAVAIGADYAITKVGGYLHDVGKAFDPTFFSENAQDNSDVHDFLMPHESCGKIKSHVTIGVREAKKYSVPATIIDIIQEHHGTSLIKYFYHKAKVAEVEIEYKTYHYDGPIPQSKEAALIMISDIIESTVKSTDEKSKESFEKIINNSIENLIKEKQLLESKLLISDIEKIKESILISLQGIYGKRVKYPS